MMAAAMLGWIDGIMMSYNHRLMVKDEMKKAVDACVKAGIGLTAMKTQAAFSANFYASIGSKSDQALQMTDRFMKKGFTTEQAKLKAVWENPHITSICSAMPNMTILQANIAAALNKQALSRGDKQCLRQYAHQTAGGYCAGCAHICESAMAGSAPISDLLRCAMYAYDYGDREKARSHLHTLPAKVKADMVTMDYSEAEKRCPQQIRIGRIIKSVHQDLV